jgi:hypothetical protein
MAARRLPKAQAEPPSSVSAGRSGLTNYIPDGTRPVHARAAVYGCFEEGELKTFQGLMANGQLYEARKTEGCTVLPAGLPATVLTTDGLLDMSFKVAISPAVGSPIILWATAYGFQN